MYALVILFPSALYFACMNVLPPRMSMHPIHTMPAEAKRGHWLFLKLELQMVVSYLGALAIKPKSFRKADSVLNH